MENAETAPSAKCAVHPTSEAAFTCARCGAFACEACRGGGTLCAECTARTHPNRPHSSGRAAISRTFLWTVAGLRAIDLLIAAAYYFGLVVSDAALRVLTPVSQGVALAGTWLFLGSAIAFLIWWHSMAGELIARGIRVAPSASDAVVAWFIPFINLVRPYAIARDAARGLAVRAPVGWWWTAFLGRAIPILFMVESSRTKLGFQIEPSFGWNAAYELMLIISAILCVRVITVIQDGLDRPAPVAPPAGQNAALTTEKGTPA